MYIVKKRLQRAKRQFNRENSLIFENIYDNKNPERAGFISKLHKTDFEKATKENERKFREPLSKSVKKFSGLDYFFIGTIALISATFGNVASNNADIKNQTINEHRDAFVYTMTLFALLLGLVVGVTNSKNMQDIYKNTDDEHFYARLSVRLFDIMKKEHPEMDETILKNCTPEISRVIATLLIKNMPMEDTCDIMAMARDIITRVGTLETSNNPYDFLELNRQMEMALSMIKSEMAINPTLYDAILNIYRGKVPATFTLKDIQKTK